MYVLSAAKNQDQPFEETVLGGTFEISFSDLHWQRYEN